MNDLEFLSSSLLSDARHGAGVMGTGIRPFGAVKRLTGFAVTARIQSGNLMIHLGIAQAGPGEILVLDAGDRKDVALVGGMMIRSMRAKGIAGLLVDGLIRDAGEIAEQDLPVFARGAHPVACGKGGDGAVNETILCGGISVHPGDFIVADEDGVIVIPRADAEATISAAKAKLEQEAARIARIDAGDLYPEWVREAAVALGKTL